MLKTCFEKKIDMVIAKIELQVLDSLNAILLLFLI